MSARFSKDPSAVLDYTVDWSAWLSTDTISTSLWTVPTGIIKVTDNNTTTSATAWFSGGTLGKVYTIVNRITTLGGRTDERTISLFLENR
jgi:hypothetical protein